MLLKIFADNIKYYRFTYKRNDELKIGLSQEELAEICDLSTHYISDLEHAKYSPSIPTIEVIAKGLNIKPSLLFEENILSKELPSSVELFRKNLKK
jgi:transcriptional regulator with XRE-family HTH domain